MVKSQYYKNDTYDLHDHHGQHKVSDVLPDDGPKGSETCRNVMFFNIYLRTCEN
jgi:hypothetical protein